jgi:hypothetical protein
MKLRELDGVELDYWVALAEGLAVRRSGRNRIGGGWHGKIVG